MLLRRLLPVIAWNFLLSNAASPTVRLTIGSFRGASANGIEKWLGIPFAEPPVGELRFKAPVPITRQSDVVKDATTFGNACPQTPADLGAPISEDCLYLNVWRPEGTTADSNLPILFWIHGGAYTSGAASIAEYDPTVLVQRSVEIGKPMIFVSTNYRVNTFGFLASSTVPSEDLNAGLLDQRQALIFLQENVAAFGGDPQKVTIWGQSAGGGSVEAHFVYPFERSLFRAGIADSSVGPFKNNPDARTFEEPGKPFARLLEATGCPADRNSVNCLRRVPFDVSDTLQKLLNISNDMIDSTLNNQLWQPSVGPPDSLIPERASARIERGDFLRLPYMAGTNLNEGNGFAVSVEGLRLSGTAENDALDNFIGHLVIDNSTITQDIHDEINRLWPANDTTLGAPFNTGDSLYDRSAAWYTSEMFLAPRRFFFDHAASVMPLFGYFFTEFIPGNPITLGVSHASELPLIFGPVPEVAALEDDFATQWRDFYINFVNDLHPGDNWAQYTTRSRQILQLKRDNITLIPDDWDLEKSNFLNQARVLAAFQK
ncbi:hypothetical protein AMATHDRAFT_152568 [Amanita thiersii Skay4041]|uniref:Carboxylic ester hydrolase n=1 Tax=Amanita thiersii Skay4041 TaxID=703135 RepID=A0A2A9ND68_9AGAR|nr:hypothetical protein AMATHDRAFT_152568 [Amanita thiersii Skay4041]